MSLRRLLASSAHRFSSLTRTAVTSLEHERRSQLVAVVVVSLVCAATVSEAVVTARRARTAWTTDVAVVVAKTDIDKGDTVTALNAELRTLPQAVIPSDALTALPEGSTARVSLRANTLLAGSNLVPASESVDVPAGWRVVALPDDVSVPELAPGDRVDVVVGDSIEAVDAIAVSARPLSVAVPTGVVARIATASRLGVVAVVTHR